MGRAMERIKNVGLVFCLFVVLLVIFSSYSRANELGTLFGALAATPALSLLCSPGSLLMAAWQAWPWIKTPSNSMVAKTLTTWTAA